MRMRMTLSFSSWVFLSLLLLVSLLRGSCGADNVDYYPTEYLKAILPCAGGDRESGTTSWGKFVNASKKDAEEMAEKMTENLKDMADVDTTVLLSKAGEVVVEKLGKGTKRNSSIVLPENYVLSLIGVSLSILFEDIKREVLTDPIGSVLKGKDKEDPRIEHYTSTSVFNLVTHLGSDVYPISNPTLLSTLESRSAAVVYFINTLHGEHREVVWLDALASVGIDEVAFTDDNRFKTSLEFIRQSGLFIVHELLTVNPVPKAKIVPADEGHFLYNWWLNCANVKEKDNRCLIPQLPCDTVISISPQLRLYVIPSLGLSMVVLGGGKGAEEEMTVEKILRKDKKIWKQILSVFDPQEEEEEEEEENVTPLQRAFEVGWPILVFSFFTLSSHVWVYWLLHGFWIVMTKFSKKAHIPRPKTAKQE